MYQNLLQKPKKYVIMYPDPYPTERKADKKTYETH